jgi:hypothetical protein
VGNSGPSGILCCSFCNKHQNDVQKLIAGPTAFICDECVGVCIGIIGTEAPVQRKPSEHEKEPEPSPVPEPPPTVSCSVCGLAMPAGQELLILRSGIMCAGCVGEVVALLMIKKGT